MTLKLLKALTVLVLLFCVALLAIPHLDKYIPSIKSFVFSEVVLYQTNDPSILAQSQQSEFKQIGWESLLPLTDKNALERYSFQQPKTVDDITQQLLSSIQASSDQEYISALTSFNTVETFDNHAVSIAGFVVPIDFHPDQTPSLVFIVPYFGACIHFPPPPPNQIIFARLDEGFEQFDITQAYRFNGILQQGLFEDPLGTSAYELKVVSINPYFENPDDFRNH